MFKKNLPDIIRHTIAAQTESIELAHYGPVLHIAKGWDSTLYLSADLQLIESRKGKLSSKEDLQNQIRAVCLAAKRYPALSEFVPEKPPHAQECELCRGIGTHIGLAGNTTDCPLCAGVGWLLALQREQAAHSIAPVKAAISTREADKIDIRVGHISAVTNIDGEEKFVKLTVHFGDHERTVVADMALKQQQPAQFIGTQALFSLNVPNKKVAGVVCEAVMLSIGADDGLAPILAVTDKPAALGARVKLIS